MFNQVQPTPSFDELMLFSLAQMDKEKRRKALERSAEDRRTLWADEE
jgi:hypothetical protein